MKESDAGAQAILSLALVARTTQVEVEFSGICGDINGNANYMQITNIRL